MSIKLNKYQIEKFSRQIVLKDIGVLGQKKIIKAKKIKYESLKNSNEISLANMIRERQPYLFERLDKIKFFRNIFSQN